MVSLFAGALCVRYSQCRDRLTHRIGVVEADVFVPFLEAIEGTENESWPSSPPMQQMVEERFSPTVQPVLLGVGLSGNGHWSTAVESIGPISGSEMRSLKFDIACKNSKPSSWFGSRYRLLAECLQADSSSIVLHIAKRQLELRVSIGVLEFSESDQQIQIAPMTNPSSIQTHRWCYGVV
jgi:hypothetical protein